MAKATQTTVAVVDKETLPSRSAAPAMPATRPGNRAMVIVPPSEIETYDVDVNETPIERDQRAIPILRILQSNSPQVADPADGGIAGAKEGYIFNTTTLEVFEGRNQGLYMIPVRVNHMVIEYVKREKDGSGGGFLNAYEPENPIVRRALERRRADLGVDPSTPVFGKIPNGVVEDQDSPHKGKERELVDTWYIDGIFVVPNEDGSFPGHFGMHFRASLAFQSSFIPVFNSWDAKRKNQKYLVRGKMQEPALWTTVWRLTTVTKPKGQLKWKIPNLTLGTDPETGVELDYRDCRLPRKFDDGSDNPLYLAAIDLNVELQEGSARLDFSKDANDAAGEASANGGNDDDIPGFDKD